MPNFFSSVPAVQVNTCHPNRRHHALGKCKSCYDKHNNEKIAAYERLADLSKKLSLAFSGKEE